MDMPWHFMATLATRQRGKASRFDVTAIAPRCPDVAVTTDGRLNFNVVRPVHLRVSNLNIN